MEIIFWMYYLDKKTYKSDEIEEILIPLKKKKKKRNIHLGG